MKRIQSRDNPSFRHLRALQEDGRYRRQQGATVLDGTHLLQAALTQAYRPLRVIVSEAVLDRPEIASLLTHPHLVGVEVLLLNERLFANLSSVETPTGIMAEIAYATPLKGLQRGDVLMLEAVQDAGNLGTLLRTAAAAGVQQVCLSAQCAQAWSPKVLRAAMGAHFALRVYEGQDLLACLTAWQALNPQGKSFATALRTDAQGLYACDLRAPVAWLLGSEGQGLSAALQAAATACVMIPLALGTESLNVSAAAAVCLFEQVRQRSAACV